MSESLRPRFAGCRGSRGRQLLMSCGLLCFGTASYGQTNDHLYRSWRWSTTPGYTRAIGLSGAYVGLADDGASALLNPAGAVTLPKSELAVSYLAAQAGDVGLDRFAPWNGVSVISGAARVSRKTALAFYFSRPRAGRIDLTTELRLPDGSTDAGYLDATVTDVGVAAARRLTEQVSIGVRVTATHLELEGFHSRRNAGNLLELETGSAAGSTRVTASLGLLCETGRLRAGVVVQPGASHGVERTATRPSLGGIDQGSQYEVRAPGVVSAGAAFRLSRHIHVSSQLDYVRYSEIQAFIRPGGATSGGYGIPSAFEPRIGVEVSIPLGAASVQLRAGSHLQAPGSLAYSGPDATEAAAFRGTTRRLLGAAGASLSMSNGFTLDLAGASAGDRSAMGAGIRFRF